MFTIYTHHFPFIPLPPLQLTFPCLYPKICKEEKVHWKYSRFLLLLPSFRNGMNEELCSHNKSLCFVASLGPWSSSSLSGNAGTEQCVGQTFSVLLAWHRAVPPVKRCCCQEQDRAPAEDEHWREGRDDFPVMYFSGVQANGQTWLPDSPLSSACSSITMELYFPVSLSTCCRDTALLYLSCYCIVALGFTHLLLRHTSVLMGSQRMLSRPNSPSRLSPSWRKYYLLPWNLWKVNTSQS